MTTPATVPQGRAESDAPAADSRVSIVGLGYVGLPLAVAFAEAGLEVVGIDASAARVRQLAEGRTGIEDVSDDRLQSALAGALAIRDPAAAQLADADAIFVCVPTPITDAKDPDLSAVLSAARFVAQSLRAGQLVVLQSTTYPGTTTGPFRAELERSGLVAGADFSLAYAPERINPGDPATHASGVPRIVGGLTREDTARAAALLRRAFSDVHELSSPDAAELAKLLENVFRNVNIALVNQLALLCERMGLDVWEIVDAAATKPFGFMPFRPGPGVGGHCIPVDPYYLAWRAREFGFVDRFVEVAGDINFAMPRHVVDLIAEALNERGLAVRGSTVGIVGVAFKPDVGDTRNSPAGAVMAGLVARGATVRYHDPFVPRYRAPDGTEYESEPLETIVAGSDVVAALTGHDSLEWDTVYGGEAVVVDAVNSSRGRHVRSRHVLRLGAGWNGPAAPNGSDVPLR
jgi:UDP-N-acetyl-D-glucosamine dehydrogenase